MSSYIVCGIVSIPIYILYNYICYKKKKISIWVRDDLLNGNMVKVVNDNYYDFQYKSSINSCILLAVIIAIGILFKWGMIFLLVFLLSFHGTVFITRYIAYKREYLST